MHVAFGFALIGAVVGDFTGADKGMGLLIAHSQGNFDAAGIYAGMIIITVLALLAESHASVHTYPEVGSTFVDVFTCGERADPEKAVRLLAEALGTTSVELSSVARGPSDSLLANRAGPRSQEPERAPAQPRERGGGASTSGRGPDRSSQSPGDTIASARSQTGTEQRGLSRPRPGSPLPRPEPSPAGRGSPSGEPRGVPICR
jgi:hypothetical protein